MEPINKKLQNVIKVNINQQGDKMTDEKLGGEFHNSNFIYRPLTNEQKKCHPKYKLVQEICKEEKILKIDENVEGKV